MRLRWKLTLSYTLVTAGAILLIEMVLLAVAMVVLTRANTLSRFLIPTMSDALVDVAPALEAHPPDTPLLTNWLERLVRTGKIGWENAPHEQINLNLDPASLEWALLADTTPHIVAVYPADGPCTKADTPQQCLPPEALTVLKRALAGEQRSSQLGIQANQKLYAAAPVRDDAGSVVGALVFVITWPASAWEWPRMVLRTLLPSAAAVTLFAALLGTLFGFLTARGLTRRLDTLSHAADAWSQGNFSVSVRDPSHDELGYLARRLNHMAEQLENLLQTRQELATLEERNRLARDLHDSVKQQIFAAGMQVAAARQHLPAHPAQAQEALAQAEALIQQAQRELTTLIRQLRPAALEGKGLVAALQDYLSAWETQTGIAADLQVQHQRPLPLAVEQALFRVVQEALANVARHSQATQATVFLGWEDQRLRLVISDNGRGFDPQETPRGLGLTSIAERIQALHGTLVLQSQPGQGTRLEIQVPL